MKVVRKYNIRFADVRAYDPPYFRFAFQATGSFSLALPEGARVLSIQEQNGDAVVWALVDKDTRSTTMRRFRYFGTNCPIDSDSLLYVSTLQLFGGGAVFHFFEEPVP